MINELLTTWEETYKKGQLTLWIFLSLKESSKYVTEIKEFIEKNSKGTIICEEQSIYRSLRKFYHVKIVDFELKDGHKGPERKYYYLTSLGKELLEKFIQRNIILFYNNPIKKLID